MSPIARQSNWRLSYLSITDTGAGIDLGFFDTDAVGAFSSTTVAPGLSYTDWHTVDFYIEFVDGLNGDGSGNDIVQIVVDGVLVHTGTTWETYYRLTYPARLHAVDAFMFRSSTAAAGNAGNGIFFDDVVVDNAASPPDLVITKTDGVASAIPGGSVTYTIVASNAGPGDAPGSTVTDTFPASLTATWTCVGAGGGTCTAAGSGNISDTVNLPAGGSVTYTVSATISAAATGTLTNTATVATAAGRTDPNPADNSATDTDTLTPQADLSITKTDGVTSVLPGGSVTYTIVASNAGPSNAPGATVTDTFPASLTATWTCVGAGGGTCTAAGSGNISDTVNLPAGGSVTYTVSATISAAATGTLSNTATVVTGAGVTDPTPANNSATDTNTVTAVPDLSITKIASGSGVAGTNVSYLITVTNSGLGVANSVVVTDLLPAGLTFVSAAPSQGSYVAATGIWTVGTVNAQGGTASLTIVAAVNMGTSGMVIQNTAAITSSVPADPTPGTGTATATITVAGAAEPAPIPTLSATALLLLAIGLAFAGWFARRREV